MINEKKMDAVSLRGLAVRCRSVMETELCDLVDELGPGLLDETRALASSESDNAKRNIVLSLRARLLGDWGKFHLAYRAALQGRVQSAGKAFGEDRDLSSLSVLSDSDVSAQVMLSEITTAISKSCAVEGGMLGRRVSQLVLREALPQGYSMFKMTSICACLEAPLQAVFTNPDERTLITRLLGKRLETELPRIYRSVNAILIDGGILPRIALDQQLAAKPEAPEDVERTQKVTSAIDRLKLSRATELKTTQPHAEKPAPGVESVFFGSLAQLDKVSAPVFNIDAVQAAPSVPENVVKRARDSQSAGKITADESVALDITGELFDLIFQDKKVSLGIKTLVGRLQMPILKVGIRNQRFFADRNHPARRFLDAIAMVAVRWGEVTDEKDPIYIKLVDLIEVIRETADGTDAAWVTALSELSAFMEQASVVEEQASHAIANDVLAREKETLAARAKQLIARRDAGKLIDPLLANALPDGIVRFLRGHWRDVVQNRIFLYGLEDARVTDAVKTAQDLIPIVVPATPTQRRANTAALPSLIRRLNGGFDEVEISAEERKAFLDSLLAFCLAVLKPGAGETEMTVDASVAVPRQTLSVRHTTANGAVIHDMSVADASDAAERSHVRLVRNMVRGDWVDFLDMGSAARQRLTWINGSRTLMLFCGRASERAISITPDALALRIQNQTVVIVRADAPLFEQAIDDAVRLVAKE